MKRLKTIESLPTSQNVLEPASEEEMVAYLEQQFAEFRDDGPDLTRDMVKEYIEDEAYPRMGIDAAQTIWKLAKKAQSESVKLNAAKFLAEHVLQMYQTYRSMNMNLNVAARLPTDMIRNPAKYDVYREIVRAAKEIGLDKATYCSLFDELEETII